MPYLGLPLTKSGSVFTLDLLPDTESPCLLQTQRALGGLPFATHQDPGAQSGTAPQGREPLPHSSQTL